MARCRLLLWVLLGKLAVTKALTCYHCNSKDNSDTCGSMSTKHFKPDSAPTKDGCNECLIFGGNVNIRSDKVRFVLTLHKELLRWCLTDWNCSYIDTGAPDDRGVKQVEGYSSCCKEDRCNDEFPKDIRSKMTSYDSDYGDGATSLSISILYVLCYTVLAEVMTSYVT